MTMMKMKWKKNESQQILESEKNMHAVPDVS